MKNWMVLLLAALLVGIGLSTTACGDDDDADTGSGDTDTDTDTDTDGDADGDADGDTDADTDTDTDADTDTDTDADTDSDTDADTDADADPFEDLDCGGATDVLICDYSICALEAGMDAAVDACETAQLDYCDGYIACYVDYVECYLAECPEGTNVADADMTAITACTTAYSTCAAELTGAK